MPIIHVPVFIDNERTGRHELYAFDAADTATTGDAPTDVNTAARSFRNLLQQSARGGGGGGRRRSLSERQSTSEFQRVVADRSVLRAEYDVERYGFAVARQRRFGRGRGGSAVLVITPHENVGGGRVPSYCCRAAVCFVVAAIVVVVVVVIIAVVVVVFGGFGGGKHNLEVFAAFGWFPFAVMT